MQASERMGDDRHPRLWLGGRLAGPQESVLRVVMREGQDSTDGARRPGSSGRPQRVGAEGPAPRACEVRSLWVARSLLATPHPREGRCYSSSRANSLVSCHCSTTTCPIGRCWSPSWPIATRAGCSRIPRSAPTAAVVVSRYSFTYLGGQPDRALLDFALARSAPVGDPLVICSARQGNGVREASSRATGRPIGSSSGQLEPTWRVPVAAPRGDGAPPHDAQPAGALPLEGRRSWPTAERCSGFSTSDSGCAA